MDENFEKYRQLNIVYVSCELQKIKNCLCHLTDLTELSGLVRVKRSKFKFYILLCVRLNHLNVKTGFQNSNLLLNYFKFYQTPVD